MRLCLESEPISAVMWGGLPGCHFGTAPASLPAVHAATWLTSVTSGLLFLSSALRGRTVCAGGYFAWGFFFSFPFPFNVHTGMRFNEESSSQSNIPCTWGKKDFLVPCGIWHRRLRHKRTEEGFCLAQPSSEQTACSALRSASFWTAVLVLVPIGVPPSCVARGCRGSRQKSGRKGGFVFFSITNDKMFGNL